MALNGLCVPMCLYAIIHSFALVISAVLQNHIIITLSIAFLTIIAATPIVSDISVPNVVTTARLYILQKDRPPNLNCYVYILGFFTRFY